MRIDQCNNIGDFRSMARRRLPGPIFHYIDGAADDEVTYRRNTEAYERCDLVPNVLAGVESIDMSITVMGQKIDMPLFCAPTALQRLFHHDGERAVAKAAEKFGTMFGISSLGTISIEAVSTIRTPKLRLHLAPAPDAQKPPQLRHAPEVGGQLFHAREVRAAPTEGLCERGFEHLGIRQRLFQHDA